MAIKISDVRSLDTSSQESFVIEKPEGTVKTVRVVLFSGGRGSRVLSRQLINNPRIVLTLAINGYDDGASTGEVRRFLQDCLGPSDFRKNASHLARELQSCNPALLDILDLRFPSGCNAEDAMQSLRIAIGEEEDAVSPVQVQWKQITAGLDAFSRALLSRKVRRFLSELETSGRSFSFSDCSTGNVVFAGCFLETRRNFNEAVADYLSLLNLPDELILNVTDGTNAHLVALDHEYRMLGSEAEIVDATRRNIIHDIYLIDRPLQQSEAALLADVSMKQRIDFLEQREKFTQINPRLLQKISEADLIIYSPGTQHSSLFPSYITPGLGTAIARNLTAIKLLITNVQEDAEISGASAVEIIEKAVRYLKEKDRRQIPTPCLITHYLLNDPQKEERGTPYVPLGRLGNLEDPRLVRIGDYEEGISGTHDAAKVLTPFIETILQKGEPQRVAVFLLETTSLNKITQTILEMVRGGIQELPVSVQVFYNSGDFLEETFIQSLPFQVRNLNQPAAGAKAFRDVLPAYFDYVILFESSGMYKGEDVVNIAALLNHRRLDAIWGSRRLSTRDVHESYKLRYRHNLLLGSISYAGSHLLSLAYLLLYGRYISDTLSGARAIRTSYLIGESIDFNDKRLNQEILSRLLRSKGEIFETPVQFFALSPQKVRRTTVFDGIHSILLIFLRRIAR